MHLVISAKDIADENWRGFLGLLVSLMSDRAVPDLGERDETLTEMSHGEVIAARRGVLTIQVELTADHQGVKRFFHAIDQYWPLWSHYVARDDSLSFVAIALSEKAALAKDMVESFISRSIDVLRDFYLVYHVPLSAEEVGSEIRSYFSPRLGSVH